ncbi:MAG: hypothetical protein RL172_1827 [Bacteroidota bacterium]|jgi:hypothetical protein
MNKKIRFAIGQVVVLMFITGCTICSSKKITCTAFDNPAFFKWFPYKADNYMLYKNVATSDTFSYSLQHAYISGAYEINRGGFNTSVMATCEANASFASSYSGSNVHGQLSIDYLINNDQGTTIFTIYFNNSYWYTAGITDTGFVQATNNNGADRATVANFSALTLSNGTTYHTVSALTLDTAINKTERAYKLLVAKNIGIIGCEMYPSKQQWLIQ